MMRRARSLLGAVVGALVVIVAAMTGLWQPSPPLNEGSAGYTPSVYLVPAAELKRPRPLMPADAMRRTGMNVATSLAEADRLLEAHAKIRVVYLHPHSVAWIDEAWLRRRYRGGLVIVGLETPHRVLGAKLGVAALAEDHPVPLPEPYTAFSAYYSFTSHWHGASSRGQTAFYAPTPELVPGLIETMVGNIRSVTGGPTAPVNILRSDMPAGEKVRALWLWLSRSMPEVQVP